MALLSQILVRYRFYYWITGGLLFILTAIYFFTPGRFVRHPESPVSSSTILAPVKPDTTIITLAFAGDVMGHDPQIKAAWNPSTKSYEYDSCFRYIKPYIESRDFALANLEVTLGGPPYKGYPQFSSPDALPLAVKNAGFDYLVTANNHSQDRGRLGIERTIRVLDSLRIPHTGTFIDTVSRDSTYPAIVDVRGVRIAILNYTYGTNGLVVQHPNVVNMIDTAVIKADILNAKKKNPDFIIATVHWGLEYKLTESPDQQKIAQLMADNGVDAIMGSHPHVIQPISYLTSGTTGKSVPVVYSMGNFISNQRDRYKNGGVVVELKLRKTEGKTEWFDLSYTPVWVYRKDKVSGNTTVPVAYTLIPAMAWEKNPKAFGLNASDSVKIRTFIDDTRLQLSRISENSFYR